MQDLTWVVPLLQGCGWRDRAPVIMWPAHDDARLSSRWASSLHTTARSHWSQPHYRTRTNTGTGAKCHDDTITWTFTAEVRFYDKIENII